MLKKLNNFLDILANFFAHRKGLIPFIAMGIIVLNYLVQFIPGTMWWAESNLLLHVGVLLAIFGFMLAWAL